ncbi:MAG: tRNA (guanosine(46)-N7)-methyltransferase TrmB [Campylobacterota bacterium]|nr:tRNA (guanosine(46)-N7)-methyltransferase TrmB [Campylobacterota bacterium]
MPHILLSSHDDIELNKKNDLKSKFDFIAKSKYDEKIGLIIDNKEVLLTKVKKNNDDLIKLDISTRLTPVSLMKNALNDYAKVSNADILFSNTNSIHNKMIPEESYLKNINYFVDQFKTEKEIWVEVGFGSGKHLLHQAKENPDKIIIGLEIHTPSIEQVLKQAELQDIKNILIINYDARLFLEFLKSNSVGRIFVHFPVPWDKKPHRRVVSIEFIQESLRVLKIDGTLELRTDSPNYFEYSSSLLDFFKDYPHKIYKNQDLDVVSKYEARWKRQEKNIWDVIITSTKNSPQTTYDGSFDFPDNLDINMIKNNLSTKAIVKDDFLVHFETKYDIKFSDNSEGLLLKVILGSFNRPVAKNIIIKDGKARYFQGNPIITKTNLNAHKVLIKSLK